MRRMLYLLLTIFDSCFQFTDSNSYTNVFVIHLWKYKVNKDLWFICGISRTSFRQRNFEWDLSSNIVTKQSMELRCYKIDRFGWLVLNTSFSTCTWYSKINFSKNDIKKTIIDKLVHFIQLTVNGWFSLK